MINNIYQYVMGNILYTLDRCGVLPVYIKEQVLLRFASCSCTIEAKCCGCKVPNVFYAPKGCRFKKYPRLYSKKEWLENRRKHDLSIEKKQKLVDMLGWPDNYGITFNYDLWKGWSIIVDFTMVPSELINYLNDNETDFIPKVPHVAKWETFKYELPEIYINNIKQDVG